MLMMELNVLQSLFKQILKRIGTRYDLSIPGAPGIKELQSLLMGFLPGRDAFYFSFFCPADVVSTGLGFAFCEEHGKYDICFSK
jgi:hypothetical protein